MNRMRYLSTALVVLAAVALWAAPAAAQDIFVDYYTPQFYGDHLVLFDEDGTPFYYEGGEAWSVPDDYDLYEELVDHYWDHIDDYLQWYDEVGYANLDYRRPLSTDDYKPRFYMNYPVFFSNDGRPYYYEDGFKVYVDIHDRLYPRFVRYWRGHRDAYRRWYRHTGRYLHRYRRPVELSYYTPLYYDGYLVFYDVAGLPFYYLGGRKTYISRHDHDFARYSRHYRTHRDGYDRWYRERGRKSHNYRRHERRDRRRNEWGHSHSGRRDRPAVRATSAAERRRQREEQRARRERARAQRERAKANREKARLEHDRARAERRKLKQERREDRQERREERREHKQDMREKRKDARQEHRQDRREHKQDMREKRQEKRQDRRNDRMEKRQDRREKKVERKKEKREKRQDRKKEKREKREKKRAKKKKKKHH